MRVGKLISIPSTQRSANLSSAIRVSFSPLPSERFLVSIPSGMNSAIIFFNHRFIYLAIMIYHYILKACNLCRKRSVYELFIIILDIFRHSLFFLYYHDLHILRACILCKNWQRCSCMDLQDRTSI